MSEQDRHHSPSLPRQDGSFPLRKFTVSGDSEWQQFRADKAVMEELENKMDTGNSLAALRTTLANERTFLSWIRTGAALIGCGLAIDKTMNDERTISTTFVICGFLTGLQGVVRYYQVRQRLDALIVRADGHMELGRIGMKWFLLVVATSTSACIFYVALRLSLG